jgi:hypothetical protein
MIRAAVATALFLCATAVFGQPVLKSEPPIGSVPEGKRILIDDGSCSAGKIKEIIGGNVVKHIRRQVRCIERK